MSWTWSILWAAGWIAVILLARWWYGRASRRRRDARDLALMDQYNRASAEEAQRLREAFSQFREPMPPKYRKDAP
jgi:cytochrome c-type biogenesis protein CcmH/NrfF